MGSLLRSEPMKLVQLYVQIEAARDTLDELGQLGLIQFRDLNPSLNAFQRHFVPEIKRADEMQRQLHYFREQIEKQVLRNCNFQAFQPDSSLGHYTSIDNLELHLQDLEKEHAELLKNQNILDRNYMELIELKHVLHKAQYFFNEEEAVRYSFDTDSIDIELTEVTSSKSNVEATVNNANLGIIAGVIERSKINSFERVLWRVTRGNLFFRHVNVDEPIRDPQTGSFVDKDVFIIFLQGTQGKNKCSKLCESYQAHLYPIPDSSKERNELSAQISNRIKDLETVIYQSRSHQIRLLSEVVDNLPIWEDIIMKEKAIYHTMNLFNYDVGRKCLIAEGWCPEHATNDIQLALRRANTKSGAQVPSILSIVDHRESPPTHFITNKYTQAFQSIVDTYGFARYREINPGVFTIVTFPFLFGVMFGDVGHGFLLFLVGLALIVFEGKIQKIKLGDMPELLFFARYLILLMALFSMFCGLLYNEFFSVPMSLFPSAYTYEEGSHGEMVAIHADNYVYPIGVDPVWKGAHNELDFYNSLKMKMSVLLGVSQMTFGILLSAFNHTYFKKPYSLYFEFIPQLIFMLSIFGYMCFLIVLKWCTRFPIIGDNQAPRLINLLISMFMHPFSDLGNYALFPGQYVIQLILVVLAVVSVPIMLLVKPYLLRRDHLSKKRVYTVVDDDVDHVESDDGHEEEEFDFSEIFVHQIIHTIEFVLGAVSNTASYLRLWALSLAHAELSAVFWERLFVSTLALEFGQFRFIATFCVWSVWAALTIGVLMGMESLSAFLHGLRLHWVEFQNKFYGADGVPFIPFSFELITEEELNSENTR